MTIFKIVDGKIVGAEKAQYIESEFEPTDPVVFNPITGKIELSIPTDLVGKRISINGELSDNTVGFDEVIKGVLGNDSERILKISGVQETIDNAEKSLIETPIEKEIDLLEAQEIILSGQYIVNITNKGKKKIATIHDAQTASADGIEFDTERGDINTSDLKIAEEYKRLVEEESLEAAMDYFKSL